MANSVVDEVSSLDRLLTRLALTEDSKLEKVLSKLLPLSVSRLQSPADAVRKKVIEMLIHINQRVRDHPHIKLPVFSMLDLYRSQTSKDHPLVYNMSLEYLEMGLARSSPEIMLQIFPDLIESISTRPNLHQDRLLRSSTLSIEANYALHGEKFNEFKKKCIFMNNKEDVSVLLEFLLLCLLFNPLSLPSSSPSPSTNPSASPLSSNQDASTHPCLSLNEIDRICGNSKNNFVFQKERLVAFKLGILNVLSSMDFDDQDIYVHYLVASTDSNEKVSKRGEELFKKFSAKVDLEKVTLIKKLYSLYLGNHFSNEPVEKKFKIPPANISLKLKILSSFLHSITSSNCFPSTLNVIIDSIYVNQSNFRLKQTGMEFSVWVFKHAKEEELKPIALLILENLLKLLDQLNDPETKEVVFNLKSFTYQAIGQLCQRIPHVIKNSSSLAHRFFDYLEKEDASNISSLQECLSSFSNAYKECNDDNVKKEIEALLLKSIKSNRSATKFCTLQWCIKIFSFENVFARYICILGLADSKLENREIAEKGLQFSSKEASFSLKKRKQEEREEEKGEREEKSTPYLSQMIDFIVKEKSNILIPSPIGERDSIFPSPSYLGMLRFLKEIMQRERKKEKEKGEGKKVNIAFDQRFVRILEHSFSKESNYDLHSFASKLFLEMTCIYPKEMCVEFLPRFDWLKQFLSHSDLSVRENFSRTLGIILSTHSSSLSNDSFLDVNDIVRELLATVKNAEKMRVEFVHGSTCALGYIIAQSRSNSNVSESLQEECTLLFSSLLSPSSSPSSSSSSFSSSFSTSKSELIISAAAESIGLISLTKPLPLPLGNISSLASSLPSSSITPPSSSTAPSPSAPTLPTPSPPVSPPVTRVSILSQIMELLKSNDIRTVKKAVLALGHIAMGEKSFSLPIISSIFTLSKSKVEDVLFAAGDSIALIWGENSHNITSHTFLNTPFQSLSSSSNLLSININDVDDDYNSNDYGNDEMDVDVDGNKDGDVVMKEADDSVSSQQLDAVREMTWQKLSQEFMISPRKEERRAGVIWLLSIVTYCGNSKKIQSLLFEIQESFSNLLGDSDDLTQEMSSRGMSTVYDLGDWNAKKQLVDALINNLTGNVKKKKVIKMTDESEVLSEEVIEGKGKNFNNTYKELCDMATDLGQPELIYRFMDIANYQNALNSGRGAAFGFSKIAKQAQEMLKPHIPNLIPKLYRAQYDPSKPMQDAMTHMWHALIDDPSTTLSQYLDLILEDLITNLGSRLWRNRESASLALSDLLASKKFEQVSAYLERLWIMCFRVCDDIKESVRNAGDKLCRCLTSLSVRLCDSSLTKKKDAEKSCSIILPLLLSKGVYNSMAETRRSSLLTISKIIKVSGSSIRPNLTDIISSLLESLSSLEDQSMNYVELHAERAGIDAEKLEGLRTSMSRDSLMWQSLQMCVSHVDLSVLPNLIPRLVQIIRSGVGLNTKVGVSRFFSLLTHHLSPSELSPYSPSLLNALYLSLLNEKSASVKKANARAFCEIIKHANSSLVPKYVQQLCSLYANASSDDGDARSTAAIIFRELSNVASDCIHSEFSTIFPLVFFARFDENDSISQSFHHVFDEISGAQTAMAKLHLPEIVKFIQKSFSSSSWAFKIQSAKASMDLAQVLKEDMDMVQLQLILKLFAEELPGRLWEGKEILLECIAVFCTSCPKTFLKLPKNESEKERGNEKENEKESKNENSGDGNFLGPQEIVLLLLKSSQRKKEKFKNAALKALQKVTKAFEGFDSFSLLASPLIQGLNAPSDDALFFSPLPGIQLLSSSLTTSSSFETLKTNSISIKQIFIRFLQLSQPWNLRVETLAALKIYISKLEENISNIPEGAHFLEDEMIKLILDSCQDFSISKVRKASMEVIFSISHSPLLKEKLLSNPISSLIVQRLKSVLETEKDAEVKLLAKKCFESLT